MIRAAISWLISRIRAIGHQHVYQARILTEDRTGMITIPTAFCAICGRYPK